MYQLIRWPFSQLAYFVELKDNAFSKSIQIMNNHLLFMAIAFPYSDPSKSVENGKI